MNSPRVIMKEDSKEDISSPMIQIRVSNETLKKIKSP